MEDEDADGEVTFVVEKDEVTALVSRVEELQGAVEPSAYARISRIVERYQEFSQLLDPHLEAWIAPLAAVLRAQARLGDDADMILVQRVCSVLHAFATVRGYKTVCKFFPHEANDLEPVVHLLVRSHDARLSASTIEEADELGTAWETRAVLILWLSILVLIPFDLVTVDSEVDGGGDAAAKGDAEAPPGGHAHPRPVPVEVPLGPGYRPRPRRVPPRQALDEAGHAQGARAVPRLGRRRVGPRRRTRSWAGTISLPPRSRAGIGTGIGIGTGTGTKSRHPGTGTAVGAGGGRRWT